VLFNLQIGKLFKSTKTFLYVEPQSLEQKEVRRKTKLTIYGTSYISILTCGCESSPISSKHNGQLQATEMRSLRKIEAKTEGDRISNQTVRMGLGIIPRK
jgi:hypothetical protein